MRKVPKTVVAFLFILISCLFVCFKIFKLLSYLCERSLVLSIHALCCKFSTFFPRNVAWGFCLCLILARYET